MRRLLALFLLLALLLAALPLTSVAGAGATVTGTLASKDKTALGAGATAVVILVDQQSGVTGGTVLSTQRIDNARWPVAFAVPYDTSAIDPKHSYALYATVADTTRMLQSILPTPVITGGPTSKVAITVLPAMPTATSSLPGTMTLGFILTLFGATDNSSIPIPTIKGSAIGFPAISPQSETGILRI